MATPLIIPGLKGSGEAHWQTWLQSRLPGAERVEQADWFTPDLPVWTRAATDHMDRIPGKVIVIAHSFGCLTIAAAAAQRPEKIAAALLVAPANPVKFSVEQLLPRKALPFPTLVVGSTNDPWMSLDAAQFWADQWQADFLNLGAAGHINVDSGYGPWPGAIELVDGLRARIGLPAPDYWHVAA